MTTHDEALQEVADLWPEADRNDAQRALWRDAFRKRDAATLIETVRWVACNHRGKNPQLQWILHRYDSNPPNREHDEHRPRSASAFWIDWINTIGNAEYRESTRTGTLEEAYQFARKMHRDRLERVVDNVGIEYHVGEYQLIAKVRDDAGPSSRPAPCFSEPRRLVLPEAITKRTDTRDARVVADLLPKAMAQVKATAPGREVRDPEAGTDRGIRRAEAIERANRETDE